MSIKILQSLGQAIDLYALVSSDTPVLSHDGIAIALTVPERVANRLAGTLKKDAWNAMKTA